MIEVQSIFEQQKVCKKIGNRKFKNIVTFSAPKVLHLGDQAFLKFRHSFPLLPLISSYTLLRHTVTFQPTCHCRPTVRELIATWNSDEDGNESH